MINEDKKETCHPELVSGSHKIVGLHPTYKYSCHSERRIDLRVSESPIYQIPEQVLNDMKGKFLVPQYLSILISQCLQKKKRRKNYRRLFFVNQTTTFKLFVAAECDCDFFTRVNC